MSNCSASLAVHQAFSKLSLVNLISKDTHLVFLKSHHSYLTTFVTCGQYIDCIEATQVASLQCQKLFQQEQEVSKAHIPPAVAIRGCNTFREKTKLSKIS